MLPSTLRRGLAGAAMIVAAYALVGCTSNNAPPVSTGPGGSAPATAAGSTAITGGTASPGARSTGVPSPGTTPNGTTPTRSDADCVEPPVTTVPGDTVPVNACPEQRPPVDVDNGPAPTGTSIVGTNCSQVPATTMVGEHGGGHIVCRSSGDPSPTSKTTTPPIADGAHGAVVGNFVDRTGAPVKGLVDVMPLGLAYATGPDGTFGAQLTPGAYDLTFVGDDVRWNCPPQHVSVTPSNVTTVTVTCSI